MFKFEKRQKMSAEVVLMRGPHRNKNIKRVLTNSKATCKRGSVLTFLLPYQCYRKQKHTIQQSLTISEKTRLTYGRKTATLAMALARFVQTELKSKKKKKKKQQTAVAIFKESFSSLPAF